MPRACPVPVARWLAAARAVALAACSSPGGERTGEAIARTTPADKAPRPFDLDRPLEALRTSAEEAASRAGSFAWRGEVSWSVARSGAAPVQGTEKHRVRQLASGDFEVSAEVDPGGGPGSETGKEVVYAGGSTFARGRWAPFRERPTDRGHGARRFRDQSFRLAGDLADLYGPALAAEPAGEATVLGRAARRYRLTLSGKDPEPRPAPAGLPSAGYDADTKRRVAFLEGRIPVAAEGELLVDAQSGLPLSVRLRGAFAEREDPQLRADFDLTARVEALGGGVAAVRRPTDALPDVRKPKGVARALEAAGLRKKAAPPEQAGPGAADEDEGGEE